MHSCYPQSFIPNEWGDSQFNSTWLKTYVHKCLHYVHCFKFDSLSFHLKLQFPEIEKMKALNHNGIETRKSQ